MSETPDVFVSASDTILAQCDAVERLQIQAEPIRDMITQLEDRFEEQHHHVVQHESEMIDVLNLVTCLHPVDDQLRQRLEKAQMRLHSTRDTLAATNRRLLNVRTDLSSIPLASEEKRLLLYCREYLAPEVAVSLPSSPVHSHEAPRDAVPANGVPELEAYYEAAGWIGIWKERIEDLQYRHAEGISQRARDLSQDEDAFSKATIAFETEEATMLRELDLTKARAAYCLQQCKNKGVSVPYELPPSTVASSTQSMSAINSHSESTFSKIERSPVPVSPTGSPCVDQNPKIPDATGVGSTWHVTAEPTATLWPDMNHREALSWSSSNWVQDQATGNVATPGAFESSEEDKSLLCRPTSQRHDSVSIDGLDGSEQIRGDVTSTNSNNRPRPIKTIRWQEDEDTFIDVRDPANDLRGLIQVTPRQKITDPTLLQEGILAKGKLLPTEGETERLFENYRRRASPRDYFVRGRVFFTLWAGPADDDSTIAVEAATKLDHDGEPVHIFSRVRRFVVIQEGSRDCSCLPITTYNNRGVGKKGVEKFNHSIVYTGGRAPEPMEDELPCRGETGGGMQPTAIRVSVDDPVDQLSELSRLDYASVYTIDHNIKIRNFGRVKKEHFDQLRTQFRNVWSKALGNKDPRLAAEIRAQASWP